MPNPARKAYRSVLFVLAFSLHGCCGDCTVGFDRRCPEVLGDLPPEGGSQFLAWAYGGHPGFDGPGLHPATILFEPIPGVTKGYVQLECAPGTDADSCRTIQRFCVNERQLDQAYGLNRYRTLDEPNAMPYEDPAYLIALPSDSLIRTSNRAQSGISGTPTQYDTLLLSIHDSSPGDPPTLAPDSTPLIVWNRSRHPQGTQAVALFTDTSGALVAGILTSDAAWQYGTGADRMIRGAAPLQSGAMYALTTWVLNAEYWAVAVDQVTFTVR